MSRQAVSIPLDDTSSASWTLQVVLRAVDDGPVLAREAVTDGDLGDVKSELWMAALLRRGRMDVPLESMACRIVPRFCEDGDNSVVSAYRLETSAGGTGVAMVFTPSSLEPVATRAAQRLLDQGTLSPQATVVWDIVANASNANSDIQPPAGDVIIREIARPIDCLSVPIEVCRQDARKIGGVGRPRDFPVLYVAEALIAASRHARRGGESTTGRPVESGAALLGVLCSCARTGEFFAVVIAAEPIEHADETRFSLTLSAASWDRIESRLDELRKRYGDACRLLGQAHGHPFKPVDDIDGGDTDAAVGKSERASAYCHTAYVSRDDIAWSRAVFAREPWQLCHIFGKDRAGENVHALYGLRNGTLAWRPFSVIRNFRPELVQS